MSLCSGGSGGIAPRIVKLAMHAGGWSAVSWAVSCIVGGQLYLGRSAVSSRKGNPHPTPPPQYPLNKKLVGPLEVVWTFRERQKLLFLRGQLY